MEKLSIRCQHCDRKIVFEDRHLGRLVKCPGCSESLRLELQSKSPASGTIDPFAELADEGLQPKPSSIVRQKPEPTKGNVRPRKHSAPPSSPENQADFSSPIESAKRDAEAIHDGELADGVRKSGRAKRRSPESEERKSRGEAKTTENSADHEYAESQEASSSAEPFIDEFGLADLSSSEGSWNESSGLPPVSKQFVKKKPRRSVSSDSSSDSKSSAGSNQLATQVRKTTSFRNKEDSERSKRKLIYFLFLLTLLPLCVSLVFAEQHSLEERLADSEDQEAAAGNPDDNPDDNNPGGEADANADQGGMPEAQSDDGWEDAPAEEDVEFAGIDNSEEIFEMFPDQRLPGAFLARKSSLHWLFAALSGIGFMILFAAMFRRYSRDIGTALFGAMFTATAGIVLLMGFQWAAFSSRGFWLRGRGIVILVFLIIKFIGFSYQSALQEDNGFMLSFMGFTFGVGICEEVCKILPVIGYLGTSKNASWQGACLVGLASGVGFGVSEGIMYSSSYYNGISTGDIYLVRFISCVSLHAVWTGAGAILLYFNQDGIHGGFDVTDIASTLGMTLGISIVLHGLYDTLLKQEMPFVALTIGLLSVGWLIYIVERQTRDDVGSSP